MNIDALHEHLRHAAVVLDAGIAATSLRLDEMRTLMHVALNLIEEAQHDVESDRESLRCP